MSPQLLLVEDNEDDVALLVLALQKSNVECELTVARDGREALDRLLGTGAHESRSKAELPRLVLLDLNLPKLDGFAVLRGIREHDRTKRLPVVVLSSSAREQDIVESYAPGGNSYVQKPVSFDEFVDVIRQVLRYWLLVNRCA